MKISNTVKKSLLLLSVVFTLIGISSKALPTLKISQKVDAQVPAPSCAAGIVSGYAQFVPGSLNIDPGETKSAYLRTYVCNYSGHNLWNARNAFFGNARIAGHSGYSPIDLSPSGLPNAFGFYILDLGYMANGSWKYYDIPINVNGSGFPVADGTYNVEIYGYGVSYYDTHSLVCGSPAADAYYGCATNQVWTGYPITITRTPPIASLASSTGNCTTIRGWAYDESRTASKLSVQLIPDVHPNFGGTVAATTTANRATPDPPSRPGDNYGFEFDISQYQDAYNRTFYIRAIGINTAGNPDGKDNIMLYTTGRACAPPTCSLSVDAPGGNLPPVGDRFRVRLTVNYPGGVHKRPITPRAAFRVVYPGSPSATTPESYTFPTFSSTSESVMFDGVDGNPPDAYYVAPATTADMFGRIRQANPPGPAAPLPYGGSAPNEGVPCNDPNTGQQQDFGEQPYFKVYGNDIAAGGAYATATPTGVATTCTTPPAHAKSSIVAWSRTSLPWSQLPDDGQGLSASQVDAMNAEAWAGASTDLAAFALGEILGFYSASQHNPRRFGTAGSEPSALTGLTFGNYNGGHGSPYRITTIFSNNTDPVPATILDKTKVAGYGGRSGIDQCLPRYINESAPPAGILPGPHSLNPSGVRTVNGKQVVYVNGDVYIRNNVVYAGGTAGTPWTKDTLPSFTLIALGNIYIWGGEGGAGGVTRLDGTYIAQPSLANPGGTGKIYTCVSGNLLAGVASINTAPSNPAHCDKQLTFNGAVMAKQIKLGRTFGNLAAAAPQAPSQLRLAWVSNNVDRANYERYGFTCVPWNEPSDPHTWGDNYLCSPTNLGLTFHYGGSNPRPAGRYCVNLREPLDDGPGTGTWGDNWLCQSGATNTLGLQWSDSGPIAGMYCTPISEASEPASTGWDNNYLCEPLQIPPAVENAGNTGFDATAERGVFNTNAAEVFNATPEMYINPPNELRKSGTRNFDYVTSLPPLL